MRRAILISAAIFLSNGFDASAQNWSADEQEIIDFTDNCWDGWFQENVDQYLSECWHEDITFWFSEHSLPFGARWVDRAATDGFTHVDVTSWDFQTHTVKLYGDTAVIQYQLLLNEVNREGTREHWAEGRTDTLIRENGAWIVVAVHTHPSPISRK